MKIFLGTEEIASVLSGLNEGFESLGHQTTTYVSQKNIYYKERYDIEKGTPVDNLINYKTREYPSFIKFISLKIDARITPFWLGLQTSQLIDQHEVFVFIWRPWLSEWNLFQRLKKAGKKIICIHLGSDVRDANAYQQEFGVDVSQWDNRYHEELNSRIKKIRYHEIYADVIYSVPDQAGLMIRPYKHIYLPLSRKKQIRKNIPDRDVPVIVHAPTNSSIKGTDIILKSLEQLKAGGVKFELKLLRNLPNNILLEELSDADILVDELVLHGPGVLSLEAMAAGCAVATKTISGYKSVFDPPVCSINSENILEKIRALITDKSYRIKLAETGYQYVREFNDPTRIAKSMLDDLNQSSADYYPSFFLERFRLPSGVTLTSKNRELGNQVLKKTTHLTTEVIQRGIREGLL